MGDKAVIVSHVSKQYRLGKKAHGSLRESFSRLWQRGESGENFLALDDVSFEVKKGEAVGIVGRNGAGKSTLLKILSRITPPSRGRIEMDGQVASLLEVGTGFHPELTGRENIFLNGAILGMKKNEIRSNLDAIIDFSGIEQFIDTPVKRYSSGMYVRLAFAVAAYLNPEILIVDEVLAVGDAEFQRKCLGKMEEVASGGRTVLFVSHNMSAVNTLCQNAILLQKGKLVLQGTAREVTEYYMQNINAVNTSKQWPGDAGDEVLRPHSLRMTTDMGNDLSVIGVENRVGIELVFEIRKEGHTPVPNFHIFTGSGDVAFVTVDHSIQGPLAKGMYKSIAWIPEHFLNEGLYTIGVAISTLNPVVVHFSDYDALTIEVIDDLNAITRAGYTGKIKGAVRPVMEWKTIKLS